jgi:hypothetical protein
MIHEVQLRLGLNLNKGESAELVDILRAIIEISGERRNVFTRVGAVDDGIEIDLGNSDHTRCGIYAGKVDLDVRHSNCIFERDSFQEPMMNPAIFGNLKLLNKYLNLSEMDIVLFIAWISYTLAHPKLPTTKFLILILIGLEGSGKSFLCRLIMQLIDPRRIGLQVLPTTVKELATVTQGAQVSCFDNIRDINSPLSDLLCMIATGAFSAGRSLYTDANIHVIPLHGAVVLNSIYSIVHSPDLAQRSVILHLKTLPDEARKSEARKSEARKSEAEMQRDLEHDLPQILWALFDLIANIFRCLPTTTVKSPERMLDFVYWLAAMEQALDVPEGIYQGLYSDTLHQIQFDGLIENNLGAAILEFAEKKVIKGTPWYGTPAELLESLEVIATANTIRSNDWPKNPIALSKRLKSLITAFSTQGIGIEFSRGKKRTITINLI